MKRPTKGTIIGQLAERQKGRCAVCRQGHHPPIFEVPPTAAAALHDPDVKDAQWHLLNTAAGVLVANGIPKDQYLAFLSPIAEAIGFVGAACERFGEMRALEKFWTELVEAQGEGTYVFEVGRLPDGHGHPTRVQ